jgi:hypothetical protein
VFYAQDDTGEKQKVFVGFPSGQYLMSIRTEAEGFTGITALSSRGLSSQCILTKFAVPNTDLITTGGYLCDGAYVPATKFYEVNGNTFCNVAAAYGSTANLALLIEEEDEIATNTQSVSDSDGEYSDISSDETSTVTE